MTIEDIRLNLIENIMNSKNKVLLEKLSQFFSTDYPLEDLSEEQVEMLLMSENDIKYGRVTEDPNLDKEV